jgi:hypothetical protein
MFGENTTFIAEWVYCIGEIEISGIYECWFCISGVWCCGTTRPLGRTSGIWGPFSGSFPSSGGRNTIQWIIGNGNPSDSLASIVPVAKFLGVRSKQVPEISYKYKFQFSALMCGI